MRFEAIYDDKRKAWRIYDRLMRTASLWSTTNKQNVQSHANSLNERHNEIPVTFAEAQAQAKAREARAR